jgi:hypothetical protein
MPSRSSSVPPVSPQAAIATVASAHALSPFTLPAFSTLTVADFGWAIVLAFAETEDFMSLQSQLASRFAERTSSWTHPGGMPGRAKVQQRPAVARGWFKTRR